MCGIAGLLAPVPLDPQALDARLARMEASLAHRGPDARGRWMDAAAGIGFAHTRLAVQDLSAAGAQPMASAAGRHVICYNGEIYSGERLRAGLPGFAFRGRSDTEALLEAAAARGLEAVLPDCVGMFAAALWDRDTRRLALVRDRLGIKPLHWMRDADGTLLFASEPKALLAALAGPPPIDRAALADYLRLGYIPAPRTIWQGIAKLPPGHLLRTEAGGVPQVAPFWSLGATLAGIGAGERVADPAEGLALIEAALGEAVRIRLLADVPLGAFLSGGIDSSLIAALMQEQAGGTVSTFSIGSPDPAYDEGAQAAEVAAALGTRHVSLEVGEADCLAAVPELWRHFDEPFGDSSAVPTLLLARLARAHVTVALSGDGGDELFAGYNRHRWYARLARLSRLPHGVRIGFGRALAALPAGLVDRAGRAAGLGGVARRLPKLGGMLAARDMHAAYAAAVVQWDGLGAQPGEGIRRPDLPAGLDPLAHMQAIDCLTYLPDDILCKMDRTSMAHALEVRVPFLDHRVVRAAFRLAPELRLRDGTTKWLLREMLARRLPRPLIDRPKRGFAIPIERWLRGGLRDWAEGLIGGTDWEGGLGIDPGPIRAAWTAHLTGRTDHADRLWTVLMLAAWERGRRGG